MRRTECKPDRHDRLRAADQQSQMGASARKCTVVRSGDKIAERFCRERMLIVALDKGQLVERVGKIPRRQLELVLSGIDVIVGR